MIPVRRPLVLAVVTVLIVATACTPTGGTGASDAASGTATPLPADAATQAPAMATAVDVLAPPTTYALADVAMTLERGPCFGFCPVYTVTVHGDGRVEFDGQQHVAATGQQTGTATQEAVVALLNEFYKNHYFSMLPEYREEALVIVSPDGQVQQESRSPTDMPTQTVTLRIGTWEKVVVDYWNPPAGLRTIEEAIDTTANVQQWVGTPGAATATP